MYYLAWGGAMMDERKDDIRMLGELRPYPRKDGFIYTCVCGGFYFSPRREDDMFVWEEMFTGEYVDRSQCGRLLPYKISSWKEDEV